MSTKINLRQSQESESLLEVALDPVGGVHRAILIPVQIDAAWSKTYIWTLRSTFYDANELS